MDKTEQEFVALIKEYERVIYKVCYLYATPNAPLNDLYQEVVLNLWKAFPKFRRECKLSTWIYRISLNTCISFMRKEKRLGQLEKSIILLYLEEKSYEEISEITGLTVTNVATKLNRIKEKLRKMKKEE